MHIVLIGAATHGMIDVYEPSARQGRRGARSVHAGAGGSRCICTKLMGGRNLAAVVVGMCPILENVRYAVPYLDASCGMIVL